jgi:hypothetical protein
VKCKNQPPSLYAQNHVKVNKEPNSKRAEIRNWRQKGASACVICTLCGVKAERCDYQRGMQERMDHSPRLAQVKLKPLLRLKMGITRHWGIVSLPDMVKKRAQGASVFLNVR